MKGLRELVFFNPFTPKGSPFDEQNLLVLDRVKSTGVRQSKIYQGILGSERVKRKHFNIYFDLSPNYTKKGKIYIFDKIRNLPSIICTIVIKNTVEKIFRKNKLKKKRYTYRKILECFHLQYPEGNFRLWGWLRVARTPVTHKNLQSQNKHSRGFWLSTKYLDTDQINAKRLKKKSVNIYTPTMQYTDSFVWL